ncbi:hypothetical protein PILCRDRAFT_812653 [Piloderma croceum F 1598]|uniref:Nephrocystin 3-like N-terminal domain-containing protein n=1 Tax=Piloderma croceum (strain F 1598) TaxID=765440 RepID=A0A0C3CJG3_PILCF|nr:hypothetical protein PILCRDRAFT_812653 [Piloderma croceum F 1598]
MDIGLDHLLNLQSSQPNEDVVLSLVDKKGNQCPARLSVRVTQDSTSAVAGGAVEQAQTSAQMLSRPLVNVSDALTNVSNTLLNQQNIVTSFDALMKKVEVLVKVGDEVAKIHPYVNFAWQVLSAGMKMVQAQQARDQRILDLVVTMDTTYSFVVSADELKNQPVLQDIIKEILKQTIECGYFIREYTRRSFGERVVVHPFAEFDDQIAAFCTAFADLRKDFDSRLTLSTALFLSQAMTKIDAIRRDQLLSHLKPVDMNEYNRNGCLPDTRLDVTKVIIDWIADESSDRKHVLWLYGLAGSGKSTLSTTIARMMRDLQRLGGFFFFDRDIPERGAAKLVTMLSYQLANFDGRIGVEISRIVDSIPNIAEMPLEFQFATLLSVNALRSVEWTRGSIIIVVDAIDESGSEADRKILMEALSKGLSGLPLFVRIMVVSRQEPDIQRALGSHSHVRPYLLEFDSAETMGDILQFVRHRLEEIRVKGGFLGTDWPGDDKINALADRASGLFIWASTACLYIESYDPDQRLCELIDQWSESNSSGPFAQLDSLYKTGLQSGGLWDDPSFSSDCCSILGAILCARIPLSYSVMDALLVLPQHRPSRKSISRLTCVLRISETEGIRILHPSFHDYLSKRCSGEQWTIDLEFHNKELALRCINLLDKDGSEYVIQSKLSRNDTNLHQLAYDGHRFAQYFANTIQEHPLLLYTTALPFTPANTSIHKKFCHNHWLKVVCGVEKTWPRQLLQFQGHNDVVYSVAFSPDGSKIVSGSFDKTIRVWDASTGVEMLPPLQGHDGYIYSVAFSPDGSKIVSGSGDKTIRVWDASTGVEMLPPLQGHDDYIDSVAFSSDGSKIVSGSHDKTIRVWDARMGVEMLPSLQGHDSHIYSVAFSPDGSKIVSGSYDKTIRVWDASTGIEMLPPLEGYDSHIYSVAFSPDGSKIVSGSDDKTIRVWDVSMGVEMLPPLQGHDSSIDSVAFSPDGSKIVSGSFDKTIRVWDASTGVEMLPPLQGHDSYISSVAFSSDGSKIVSGSYDMTILVWDAITGVELPHAQTVVDGSVLNGPLISLKKGWFTNLNTGRCLGRFPVGASFHCLQVRGSTLFGWTSAYQLVIIHFLTQ